jgi:hypothetical protein
MDFEMLTMLTFAHMLKKSVRRPPRGVIHTEITDHHARVGLLQDWVDRLRKVIEERGADMADVPGGSTGLLVKDYKGRDA